MNRKILLISSVILVFLLIVQTADINAAMNQNSDSTDQVRKLPKGISIYRLDNGMQVLLIENPALPMVGANVAIKIGSAYESFSTSGMSHMLEHLLFNGTTTRDQKQLYDAVDRIGGYNNAHTDNYYTDFMMVTPAENINKGMEIQADMLFNSTLPEEKFKKEKGIVLEEISKSLADPREQLERNIISILYEGHALSLPTLGTYSTIESMSRDDVNSFYRNNYVPNNMILSVIGNFKTKDMLALIKEIYGKAKPGMVVRDENPDWATGFQIPAPVHNNISVHNRFYDGDNSVLQIFFKLPARESSEYFHLMELVFDKNKDAIRTSLKSEFPDIIENFSITTRTSPLNNFAEISVTLSKDVDLNKLANSVTEKIRGIDFQLSEETIESEETKERTDFLKNVEKPHMFGIYYSGEMVLNGVESVLSSYNGMEYFKAAEELKGLKLGAPETVIIQSPSAKDEKEITEGAGSAKLFADKTTGKNLIVVQNELSPILAIHYLMKHKAPYESKYGKDAAQILHDCFGQRMKSEAELKNSARFGFTFTVNDNPYIPMDNIYLHPDFGYIRAEGLADDLPGAIKYMSAQLKNFVPTEDEFKKAVEKFKGLSMMEMGGDKAKKLFDKDYEAAVFQPNPYPENEMPLTYENLLEFTNVYFNPANMIVSVVSPGSPESVNEYFDDFTGIPDANEPQVYTPTYQFHSEPMNTDTSGGGERSYLFWGFISQIDPEDAPALQALSLILSDNIVFDIREKQGMAYHMSAGVDVIKDKALFFISQGTRPQNVDKLVPQYPGFFKQPVLKDLSQADLEKSVNMYLGRMMFRRLSSINQAYYLGTSLYFENDINYDKEFLEQLKKVKVNDVKTVAEKYMSGNNPILIVLR